MRLRTFKAADLQDAMKMIRDSMGENAVIISTSKEPTGKGISVTVAAEEEENTPQQHEEMFDEERYTPPSGRTARNENTVVEPVAADKHYVSKRDKDLLLKEVDRVLRFHNTPDYLMTKLIETSRYVEFKSVTMQDEVLSALTGLIETSFSFSPIPLEKPGCRLMLVGSPGTGKTMTLAKMAAHCVMDRNKVTVITTDDKRAGGIDQLSAFTTILGLDLKIVHSRNELKAELKECPPDQRVLIDSAGANPYDLDDLKELAEFTGVNEIEPVLVMAAGIDCGEAEETARAFSFLGIRRLVVTRVDTSRRFGSLLAAANAADLSFSNMSSSAKAIGEFRKMSPGILGNLLMQYRI